MADAGTLLLIHGGLWEDTSADWFWMRPGIVSGLERLGFSVVAPDRLRRAPSWPEEARHIASSLVSLSDLGAAVTVVGGSFGCSVAVRLALDFPALVRRLVLAWPAAVGDQFVATRLRAELARIGARPGVIDALLGTGTLPSATDTELGALPLSLPVGVLPSVPPNPIHSRGTVDALVRLLPSAVELPGCPEPPRPEFPPHLESFLAAVAAFAGS